MKIAFAGTGFISKIHAVAARNVGAELVAVINHQAQSMEKFAAQYSIHRQYKTVEALIKDGDVDALVVSTPNYLHCGQSIAALAAGIHVLVEKPMAMNAAECSQMIEASLKSGATLMVAHCWRFDEDIRWLKNQVPRLGKIIRTKGYGVHTNWGPSGWFTQKALSGGGALVDMGIHALDTARFLLGDPLPVSVYAKIGTYYKAYDVDDTGVIIIEWDNGTTSYVESGWWQPHVDGPEAATQLYGTLGFGQLFPTRLKLPGADQQVVEIVDPGFTFPRPDHSPQSIYDTQMAYFLDCIRRNQAPVPGGQEGLVNMKLVDAAYQSSLTNKVVEIK